MNAEFVKIFHLEKEENRLQNETAQGSMEHATPFLYQKDSFQECPKTEYNPESVLQTVYSALLDSHALSVASLGQLVTFVICGMWISARLLWALYGNFETICHMIFYRVKMPKWHHFPASTALGLVTPGFINIMKMKNQKGFMEKNVHLLTFWYIQC